MNPEHITGIRLAPLNELCTQRCEKIRLSETTVASSSHPSSTWETEQGQLHYITYSTVITLPHTSVYITSTSMGPKEAEEVYK